MTYSSKWLHAYLHDAAGSKNELVGSDQFFIICCPGTKPTAFSAIRRE